MLEIAVTLLHCCALAGYASHAAIQPYRAACHSRVFGSSFLNPLDVAMPARTSATVPRRTPSPASTRARAWRDSPSLANVSASPSFLTRSNSASRSLSASVRIVGTCAMSQT